MRIRQILAISITLIAAGCTRPGAGPATSVRSESANVTHSPTLEPTKTIATFAQSESTSAPPCVETEGSVESGAYSGVAVAEEVPYLAYLPPCYGDRKDGYPVLYLLHGYPYDQNHWIDLGVVPRADQSISSGDWPPLLLVMPLQPEPLFRSSDGGPGSYETEFLEGLIPYIDDNYHTNQALRGVAGISRGGIWALEIAFRNPQHFDSVGALSPALAVNHPRPPYDPFNILGQAETLPRLILFAVGSEDWAEAETNRLAAALSTAGFESATITVPGEHNDATWASLQGEVIDYLITK